MSVSSLWGTVLEAWTNLQNRENSQTVRRIPPYPGTNTTQIKAFQQLHSFCSKPGCDSLYSPILHWSLRTLCSTSVTSCSLQLSSCIWKSENYLKKAMVKKKKKGRCEVPSFSFPVNRSVLRAVAMIHESNANSSTSAEQQHLSRAAACRTRAGPQHKTCTRRQTRQDVLPLRAVNFLTSMLWLCMLVA